MATKPPVPPKRKRGRPPTGRVRRAPIVLGRGRFERYCGKQCTEEEIAAKFHVSVEGLSAWCKRTYGKTFREVFAQKRKAGLVSLRSAQWAAAVKDRNPTTLIWLGKQYLGQRDEIEVQGSIGLRQSWDLGGGRKLVF